MSPLTPRCHRLVLVPERALEPHNQRLVRRRCAALALKGARSILKEGLLPLVEEGRMNAVLLAQLGGRTPLKKGEVSES
jgi:hypothetical protein